MLRAFSTENKNRFLAFVNIFRDFHSYRWKPFFSFLKNMPEARLDPRGRNHFSPLHGPSLGKMFLHTKQKKNEVFNSLFMQKNEITLKIKCRKKNVPKRKNLTVPVRIAISQKRSPLVQCLDGVVSCCQVPESRHIYKLGKDPQVNILKFLLL